MNPLQKFKRFPHTVNRLCALSPNVLCQKVLRKAKQSGVATIGRWKSYLGSTYLANEAFLKSLNGFKTLEEFVAYMRKRTKLYSFFKSGLKEGGFTIEQNFPEAKKEVIYAADEICEHIFNLLGSGPVKVYYGMKAKGFEGHCYDKKINSNKAHSSSLITGKKALSAMSHEPSAISYEPIDWHIDFKSGYRWNPKYYKDIKYGYRLGVDVKVPWELSRLQHLTTLGEAYFLSKNEKYVKEFVSQVIDWIENNSPKFGVNWVCTMDVAIRVCNWLLAWEFFKNSPSISDEFIIKFFKGLLQHGRHIKNNLEYSETLTSNHYLSDIVGLVYLGVLVPEFKESKKWKNLGIEELKKEMKKQVYPDGVDFEASTCYHRLVLELFFYAAFLIIINDKDFKEDNFIEVGNEIFGEKYIQRLYKMFEFILYALKPNGRMPQIGDNDNGRFHVFTGREVLDMRYLLSLGAIFFREPKFKIKEFGFCEEALWVFGEKGYKIWQDLKENFLANIGSQAFPDAGWYVMRNNKDYMIISCGPNGQNGNGGHCHNDKLSFELCVDGQDIIVDPGTYVYTAEPEWRNKFRSTAYHNTVVVDGMEQNRFNENNLFGMTSDAQVKVNEWETNDNYDFWDAQHSGYERLSEPVTHRRQILFNKREGYWVIKDILTDKEKHTFDLYFHFSPVEIIVDNGEYLTMRTNCKSGPNLAIVPINIHELSVGILNSWACYSYGAKVKAPVIKYSKTDQLPTGFIIVLFPANLPKTVAEIKKFSLSILKRHIPDVTR